MLPTFLGCSVECRLFLVTTLCRLFCITDFFVCFLSTDAFHRSVSILLGFCFVLIKHPFSPQHPCTRDVPYVAMRVVPFASVVSEAAVSFGPHLPTAFNTALSSPIPFREQSPGSKLCFRAKANKIRSVRYLWRKTLSWSGGVLRSALLLLFVRFSLFSSLQ